MKITIIISSNDSETVWNAFRFASTSLGNENDVTVFLLGKGVEALTVSTLNYDIQEQVDLFVEFGGTLIGCGICCEIRKDEFPDLVTSLACEIGSMQTLHAQTSASDQVYTF